MGKFFHSDSFNDLKTHNEYRVLHETQNLISNSHSSRNKSLYFCDINDMSSGLKCNILIFYESCSLFQLLSCEEKF
jgi:hypothetical protein